MSLTDDVRKKISDAIEGNNDIKTFIAGRAPHADKVKQFKAHVAAIDSKLGDLVEGWTISYPLDPAIHYRMRSRASQAEANAPVVGIIREVDKLPAAATQAGIQNSIGLLEMYPAGLAEIVKQLLNLDAVRALKITEVDLQAGSSLCIQLSYAFANGGAGGCTANVCPHG